jgi:cell division septal protein FtsQ
MNSGKTKKIHKFNKHKSSKNPFVKEKKKNTFLPKLGIFVIVVSVFFMIKTLFFHEFFYIKIIQIEGLERIQESEIKESVKAINNYKKLFIFPANNYFLVDVKEISSILKSKYPIQSIFIEKTFPNLITIRIEEKISTVIYDNGKKFSYVDLGGRVVDILRQVSEDEWDIETEIVTTTNDFGDTIDEEREISRTHILQSSEIIQEMGNYPIIYDKRGLEIEMNNKVIQVDTIKSIINWYNFINNYTDMSLRYVTIENELGNATIHTNKNWLLYVSLGRPVETQFEQLQTLLEKEIVEESKISYIDLRYKNRAYWK